MESKYLLDLQSKSVSYNHTPSLVSRQLPFYVTECGHFLANTGYFTERQEYDSYLLFYTLSGSGYLKYRGEEYSIRPKQVFLINCYEYQYYKTDAEGFWNFKWVHFNGAASKNYFDLINDDSLRVITLSDTMEIERQMDGILNLILEGDMLIDIKLSMLMTNILSGLIIEKASPVNRKKFSEHNLLVNKVIAYIQSNYSSKINMKDFLNLVHMSEFHFLRLFKKYTGVSPYEYLINYRINQSKTLLKETTLTVNEISYQVGFGNINNFIRDFKKLVGTTPLKYRNFWLS